MLIPSEPFDRSIREQREINRRRTPTERFLAMCALLDAAREMAPKTPEARQRRLRARAIHDRQRERDRAQLRRFLASRRTDDSGGL